MADACDPEMTIQTINSKVDFIIMRIILPELFGESLWMIPSVIFMLIALLFLLLYPNYSTTLPSRKRH